VTGQIPAAAILEGQTFPIDVGLKKSVARYQRFASQLQGEEENGGRKGKNNVV